jgi:hypothetical protein
MNAFLFVIGIINLLLAGYGIFGKPKQERTWKVVLFNAGAGILCIISSFL